MAVIKNTDLNSLIVANGNPHATGSKPLTSCKQYQIPDGVIV